MSLSCTAFIARRYASAVYAVILCLFVRPSQADTVPKRLNVGSRKHHRTIAQGLYFSVAKDLSKIPTRSPQLGRQIEVG